MTRIIYEGMPKTELSAEVVKQNSEKTRKLFEERIENSRQSVHHGLFEDHNRFKEKLFKRKEFWKWLLILIFTSIGAIYTVLGYISNASTH